MKKLLLILLPLILFLVSCGGDKGDLQPVTQSLEETLVGHKWCLSNADEDGFSLTESGSFFTTKKCTPHELLGVWIIEDSLIKYSFTQNSIQTTVLWGQVTEYSATEVKILLYSDQTSTIVMVYSLTPEDVYGCMDLLALNFNSFADCDDSSCIYLSYGCTDSLALNYDSLAIKDDGSCQYSADITIYLDVSGANFLDSLGVQLVGIRMYVNGVPGPAGELSVGLGFTYIPPCDPPDPDAANFSLEWQNSSETLLFVEFTTYGGTVNIFSWIQTYSVSANDCLTLGLSDSNILPI